MHLRFRQLFIIPLIAVLLTAIFSAFAYAAFKVPSYKGYVTDLADIISPETEQKITQIAKELKQKTSAEIAVLTIPTLDGTPIEQAGLATGRKWGVGSKKAGNTGLLILVVPDDRQMRIEVGYGLEGIITDGTAGQIRDEFMIPSFKQGNYDQGILQGVAVSALKIATSKDITLESLTGVNTTLSSTEEEAFEGTANKAIFAIFMFLFIGYILLQRLGIIPAVRHGSRGGYGGFSGGGFGGGSSFGGFGGGSFGGGGASGRW